MGRSSLGSRHLAGEGSQQQHVASHDHRLVWRTDKPKPRLLQWVRPAAASTDHRLLSSLALLEAPSQSCYFDRYYSVQHTLSQPNCAVHFTLVYALVICWPAGPVSAVQKHAGMVREAGYPLSLVPE